MIPEQWLGLSAIFFESVSWEHGHPTQLIRISASQQKTEDAQKAVALNSCKNCGHGFILPLYTCECYEMFGVCAMKFQSGMREVKMSVTQDQGI